MLRSDTKYNPMNFIIGSGDKSSHPALALLLILVVASILANFIPSGEYQRMVIDGKTMVDPDSFQYIEKQYVGVGIFFQSFYHGFVEGSGLLALVLFVGAAFFGVAKDIGILEQTLKAIYHKIKHINFTMFVYLFMLSYGLLISFTGMFDLGSVFIPLIIPLCIAMGYDAMTGAAIILVSACVGYGAAMANPFFTANAHLIAELPIYSAAWFRGICFVLMLIPGAWFINRYAQKVKKDPSHSLTADLDLPYQAISDEEEITFTSAQKRAGVVFFACFAYLIYGSINLGFGFAEITGTFAAMAILTGIAYGMSLNDICKSMTKGMSSIFIVVVVMLLARAVLYVLEQSRTIDTIIHFLSQFIEGTPYFSASVLFFVQSIINFIIPSGSGQALITMPMVTPLADIAGLSRQVAVLASQYGDGFANLIFPTNGSLLAILAISGIPYARWFKFFWKLYLLFVFLCLISIWIAIAINLQ
ncbi:YfcC family protein [Pseudemcibacter aquimaris]|uniref:YfcC family protein n=1 Tax=Pseudemcibacter aquimaris TaxID=2857064 RepID=UPI002012E71D|nr:Na+/H+ antiporter NhaC family protein [Pseudemcibacter aquimaris]MCC3861654.1 TIGR00366 family protein [Pseudemcibacter aquimaris]WDU58425.1 TIGR00366 family protein [Pseudemcibacter aquimaris]